MIENDKKPTSIRSLSGIDALYYQVIIYKPHYTQFYHNVLLTNQLSSYARLSMKSPTLLGQFVYFDLYSKEEEPRKICSIQFKNLNEKDGLESITIHHYTTYMNTIGYLGAYAEVMLFIEETLGLRTLGTKIQRLDLNTYLFGYDLDFIDFNWFSTLSKKSSITTTEKFQLKNKETFTLGSRNNKCIFLRIYDKRAELIANDKDMSKQAMIVYRYDMKYNTTLNVMEEKFYNIEFELKREILKSYRIETVEDALSFRYHIMQDIMTKRMRMLCSSKNYDTNDSKIKTHHIWEFLLSEYLPDNEKYDITRLKKPVQDYTLEKLLEQIQKYKKVNGAINPHDMQIIKKELSKRL